jgi:DNA-binding NarL/FixJ family response regulator
MVVLVDPRLLVRASLAAFLESLAPELSVMAVSSVDELVASPPEGVRLLRLYQEADRLTDDPVVAWLEEQAGVDGGPALVLLTDGCPVEEMVAAVGLGVRGCIPTSLPPPEVVHALRLVLAGGVFLPASAMVQYFQRRRSQLAAHDGDGAAPQPLSQREEQVLSGIQQGKGNKQIAHDLALHPSTIKVHLRNIRHKLGARNRTEAALLGQRLHRGGEAAD